LSRSDPPQFEPLTVAERRELRRGGALSWLRLMRLPNVFTAIADVAMGYLFTHGSLTSPAHLATLAFSSASLYLAGMVLNDVFDLAVDAAERPHRPLPSGQISLTQARILGFSLLIVGLALGWLAGFLPGESISQPWRSGLVASFLAVAILAYDAVLKQTPLGPLGMGACRLLNVLLGMSTAPPATDSLLLGYGPAELGVAAGIGVYIAGVTWFSRSEAGKSRSIVLVAAMVVMTLGVILIGKAAPLAGLLVDQQVFSLLLALLMFTVLRRASAAVVDPQPQKVQAAVKHSILSLIWLDAAIVLAIAPPAYAIAIAALLIPALLLGRWVYST
jgi:4-hydroxybenzoate polyprenyltransferase